MTSYWVSRGFGLVTFHRFGAPYLLAPYGRRVVLDLHELARCARWSGGI